MADARLGILLQADTSQATGSIAILEKQLERLQRIASLPGLNFRQQERLNAMLRQTQGELTRFKSSAETVNPAMTKFTTTTNQSTLALTNFGRIVQDAPFGFIGISNNLNPMLESFQRLKQTTGSAGGALKAMVSQLRGAGGLGLAVSLASSALVLFSGRMFGAGRATKEANDRIKELGSELAGQLVKLTTIVGVVNNVTTSYADKKNALAALNQEYGTYIRNLGIEEVTLNNVSGAYEKIVDSMLRQAVVKGLQEEITKQVEESAKTLVKLGLAQQRYLQSLNKQTTVEPKVVDSVAAKKEAYEAAGQALNRFNNVTKDGFIAQSGLTEAQRRALSPAKDYEALMARIKAQLLESISPAMALAQSFSDLGVNTGNVSDKGLQDLLKKAREIQEFFEVPFEIKFSQFDTKQEELNKARETLTRYLSGTLRLKIPVQAELDFTPPEDPSLRRNIFEWLSGLEAGLDKGVFELKITPTIADPPSLDTDRVKKIVAIQDKLNKLLGPDKAPVLDFSGSLVDAEKTLEKVTVMMGIADSIAQNLSNSFGAFIDEILRGENAMQAFGNLVQNVMKQVIADLLRAIATAAILSAIPGGTSLSFGAEFLNQLAGRREKGGPVTGGKPYIVGEKGAELFVPQSSGTIINNKKLKESFGQFKKADKALSYTVYNSKKASVSNRSESFDLSHNDKSNYSFSSAEKILFGGFRASGGNVKSNTAYMVGEKGKELFIPETSGFIVSNQKLNKLLEKSRGLLPAYRQLGGSVAAFQQYFVGERGPELFIPQLPGMSYSQGSGGLLPAMMESITVNVRGRISGNDLLLSNERTGRSNGRNG